MKFAAGIIFPIAALTVAVAGDAPTIYRCEQAGATIYSDRPCAADASAHELDDSRVTVYAAPATFGRATSAVTKRPAAVRPKAHRQGAASPERRQVRCAKLDQSLRDVRTKMRTGYGVEEGERLKERHRRLAAQRRSEKCS